MTRFFIALPASLLLAAACFGAEISKPGSDPPGEPVFTPARTRVWAGSVLRLHVRGSGKHLGPLSARVGDLPAALAQLDDTSYTLLVPQASTGPQAVTILAGGEEFAAGTIDVAGAAGWSTYPVNIQAYAIEWWPDPGRAVVIGTGPTGFHVVDLDRRTYRTMPEYRQFSFEGPGLSYRPGIVLLQSATGEVDALEYDGATASFTRLGAAGAPGGARILTELGPFVFLRLGTHVGDVVRYPGAAPTDAPVEQFRVESPYRVVVSPARNRATIESSTMADGLSVFTAPAGELAFTLPDVVWLSRAAFHPDGSRLALVQRPSQFGGDHTLRVYDALGGQLLAQSVLEGIGRVHGLMYDRVRPLIYLATHRATDAIVLEVRRSTDLTLVGRMEAAPPAPNCGGNLSFCDSATLAQGPGWSVHFAFEDHLAREKLTVLKFDLLDE